MRLIDRIERVALEAGVTPAAIVISPARFQELKFDELKIEEKPAPLPLGLGVQIKTSPHVLEDTMILVDGHGNIIGIERFA